MSIEFASYFVVAILIGVAWYLVKNDISVWRFLYSKKSLGFFLIFSVALSFYEQYAAGSEGSDLFFSSLLGAPVLFIVFLILGLPLLGVSLALLGIMFTKEYRDGISKDLDKMKRNIGELAESAPEQREFKAAPNSADDKKVKAKSGSRGASSLLLFFFGAREAKKYILNSQPFVNPPPGYQITGLKNRYGNTWRVSYRRADGFNSSFDISKNGRSGMVSIGRDEFHISWND